ncbi:polysaccharide deacetylase family protein [Paenibacillus sp. JX-17]|uniref:Polysaccharide deacetylase family protein n=1 Tax=Paenibacillus lacisoli TaxID=3064525 RepID=A0ABT9CKD2_9BACL|nr:polysaccharide deacetylase family protein [Paenibacillus sp. JX-17]MDO7908126.1 polysaccharide deacetylase family protein [Paenibacillus sp. JX-17]
MQTLLLWLFYISSFYAFIPGIISRLFGFRVFRKGKSDTEFSLTFDDGPDPTYTPQLLDLLQKYNAKATFFVVGANAEKSPELLKRMYDEGHLIGIHNYVHRTNWLMRPGTVKKQIARTDQIIYDVTKHHTSFYRPPWGIVNFFDVAKRSNRRIILWSAMFGDWREKIGADRLTERMLKKLRGGEVMLLHDCGSTLGANEGAPQQMLIALERVLIEAEKRGLRSVTVDQLAGIVPERAASRVSPAKRALVQLWLQYEKVFHYVFHLKAASPVDPILHYRLRAYHGASVDLEDGTLLEDGDPVIELHFDNKKLFEIGTASKTAMHLAIKMIRQVEKQLPELAEAVYHDPELRQAKALYGVSMINRGPEQFGFMIRDLPPGIFAASTKMYLKVLMSVIHPAGQERLKQRSQELVPKMMLMPNSVLMYRFLKSGFQEEPMLASDGALELAAGQELSGSGSAV